MTAPQEAVLDVPQLCPLPKAHARMHAHLNGWLVLTDCQLTVSTNSGFAPGDVFELIFLPLHKAVIGELPSVRICLAKSL